MRRKESNQTKENQLQPPDKSAWCKITFPFTKPQYMLGGTQKANLIETTLESPNHVMYGFEKLKTIE